MTTVTVSNNTATVSTSARKVNITTIGIQGPAGADGAASPYTNADAVPITVGGISAGSTFNNVAIVDVLDQLLYPYQAPAISLSVSPSNALREYGDDVASVTLTASTTEKTNPITAIRFYRGATLLQDGLLTSFVDTTPVVNTITFKSETTDGTQTVSATKTFSFVYPFYWGVGAQSLAASQVALLTKSISTKSNKTISTSPTGQVFYFAFPASYGLLSTILDPNNFNVTADYTVRVENIIGLDGLAVSYNIYEFNNVTTQTAFSVEYKF